MDHTLALIIPILEILEIKVSNILYNPGNIGKLTFSTSPILEILEIRFFHFLLSWKACGGRAPPGVRLRGAWILFGTCFLEFPDILEILEI